MLPKLLLPFAMACFTENTRVTAAVRRFTSSKKTLRAMRHEAPSASVEHGGECVRGNVGTGRETNAVVHVHHVKVRVHPVENTEMETNCGRNYEKDPSSGSGGTEQKNRSVHSDVNVKLQH